MTRNFLKKHSSNNVLIQFKTIIYIMSAQKILFSLLRFTIIFRFVFSTNPCCIAKSQPKLTLSARSEANRNRAITIKRSISVNSGENEYADMIFLLSPYTEFLFLHFGIHGLYSRRRRAFGHWARGDTRSEIFDDNLISHTRRPSNSDTHKSFHPSLGPSIAFA